MGGKIDPEVAKELKAIRTDLGKLRRDFKGLATWCNEHVGHANKIIDNHKERIDDLRARVSKLES